MALPFVRQGYHPNDDDYYVILDVDFNASQETITSAYRNLARRFHPDKNNHDERTRAEARIIFDKIKTAYDVLGDPHKRKIYDTLGVDGVKMDGWKLVKRQMTAKDIREEYIRIKQHEMDKKFALVAKPRAAFTIAVDATGLFRGSRNYDDEDQEYDDDEIDLIEVFSERCPHISAMSASMGIDHRLAPNHNMTVSCNINTKNGNGDGSFATRYGYQLSNSTQLDLVCQLGRGHLLKAGINHQLNDRTSLHCSGFIVGSQYRLVLGSKLGIAHKIRNNLIGKITYREDLSSTLTAALIYTNEKLMVQLTTSYKLSKLDHGPTVEVAYRFNNDQSKLSVALAARQNEGVSVEYGCETTVFDLNLIGATVAFSLPSGVTLKIRYNRANQELSIPIYLSDEVHSAPIFYGTMVPLICYYIVDRCYLKHFAKEV